MLITPELKEAQRALATEKQRNDRLRNEIARLRKQSKEAEDRGFIRGSAVTVAHHMCAWHDDNLALAYNDLVVSHIKGEKPDAAKYAAVVAALTTKYDVELQGDREILELVYEPTIAREAARGEPSNL
jgi:hypothetical protein